MLIHILVSGVLGTSIMTLFTYIIASITGKELSEPKFLNRLMWNSNLFHIEKDDYHLFGWCIHVFIGIVFAASLMLFKICTGFDLTICIGIFLGFVLGLIGVAGWTMLFTLHHNPPEIDFKLFLSQLVIAHMVFGLVVSSYVQLFGL